AFAPRIKFTPNAPRKQYACPRVHPQLLPRGAHTCCNAFYRETKEVPALGLALAVSLLLAVPQSSQPLHLDQVEGVSVGIPYRDGAPQPGDLFQQLRLPLGAQD